MPDRYLQVISTPHVNLEKLMSAGTMQVGAFTYWRPTRLNVNRAIRIDSVEPLIEGVPVHDED